MITRASPPTLTNCLCCGKLYKPSPFFFSMKDDEYWRCSVCNVSESKELMTIYRSQTNDFSVKAGKRQRQKKRKPETVMARAAFAY